MTFQPYDGHTHTFRSHDSDCIPSQLCDSAIKKGLAGFAVTNHCDMHICKTNDVFASLIASDHDVQALRSAFGDQLQIASGVEIGEGIWFPEETEKIYKLAKWDVVLGSVHTVRYDEPYKPYSVIDYTDVSDDEIHAFLACYFRDVEETLDTVDMDVLCHLTCPLRYLVGKFAKNISLSDYQNQIHSILEKVIRADVALEVNTSGIGSPFNTPMPDGEILQSYYNMGGRKLTLASDTHTPERIGNGFSEVIPLLKQIGFDTLYFFMERKAISYLI